MEDRRLDSIRVGFIGTGRISDLHALEYLRNPHAEIVALCDSDPDLASGRAEAWGLDRPVICGDYHELLALDAVDLVEILLPHHLHPEAALAAFAAGKGVFLQKPVALNLADADRVIDAAEQAGVPFRVYENFIFYPPVVTAKELVDQGAIGEPLTIRLKSNVGRSETAWPIPKGAQEWRQDPARSGGGPLLFDDGQHKFALAWHFMGQAEEVHAWIGSTTAPDGYVFDAPAMVSFRFPGGRCGNLEVVYSPDLEIDSRHYAQDDRVEITGSRGVLWINGGHGRLGDAPPLALYRDGTLAEFRDVETGWERSFVLSTRHYLEVLTRGGRPVLTAREGRQVLRFAIAAQESARIGRAVPVDAEGSSRA
jgi:predicted dehydrogenase